MSKPAAPVPATPRVRSVRVRLLLIALLPMLVVVPLLLVVTMTRWSHKLDQVLVTKVTSDLIVARQYLARLQEINGQQVAALGDSARFRDALERFPIGGTSPRETDGPAPADPAKQAEDMQSLLDRGRAGLGLDYLYLADAAGRVLAASPVGALPQPASPVIAAALEGRVARGIEILPPDALAALSPHLAAQAAVALVPTPAAVPTDRRIEDRGMVIQSASPVSLPAGERGVLAGGLLLNRNLGFIDTINDLVYREGSLPEGSQGTATLFLDDVRISTNVRLFEGERALGTRVSRSVRDHVLGEGKTWLDSAFVVNDWYISAYEPITDARGERVGMLYVGFLEAPFEQARQLTVILVGATFLAAAAASVPLFLHWARGIFKPLEAVTGTIVRVEAGDLGARTAIRGANDEIARVAEHLDHLLDQIEARDSELRSLNADLNARVEERTANLRRANLALEAATRQLVLSEKLASIGEITAGVVHEINNPVAVIQGNLEVLRQIMADRAGEADVELRLIDEQARRISALVDQLLQFARPEEFETGTALTDPLAVIAEIRPLVRHLLAKGHAELATGGGATGKVLMNASELQQVLVNLVINAIQAMPDGGRIDVRCEDAASPEGQAGVAITVRDEGRGMDAAILARIFDPFFTTRGRAGTGLGLSICQNLVSRQGGTMTVESRPGAGTRFTIWLPQAS